jgi:hypothetical protein
VKRVFERNPWFQSHGGPESRSDGIGQWFSRLLEQMPSLRDFGKLVSIHDQGFRSLCELHPWQSNAAALRLMNTDPILYLIYFCGRKMVGNRESMPNSVFI